MSSLITEVDILDEAKNTFLTYSYDIIGTKVKSQEDITNE